MVNLDFLHNDYERVSYLANLLTSRATGLTCDENEYVHLRNELVHKANIAQYLPSLVRQHRTLDSFWSFIQPKFSTYAERRTYLSEQFTPLLDALEFNQPLHTLSQPITSSSKSNSSLMQTMHYEIPNLFPSSPTTRNKRKVFIVHGRDNEAKQEVSRFIMTIGLEPIILHEQASSGMTIIQKIEHYSNEAAFALVLYTACDQGRGYHESNQKPKDRARQNVVFEHGYLMAKLGRQNVCALVKGFLETPNDLSGVVYVELDDRGAWKLDVVKELKASGYNINF